MLHNGKNGISPSYWQHFSKYCQKAELLMLEVRTKLIVDNSVDFNYRHLTSPNFYFEIL